MLDERQLQEQAERCRRLARDIGDRDTQARLQRLAGEYEERAKLLRSERLETRSFAPRDGDDD